ncbi:hypothetical protein [Nocardia sp. BMG51109]|uniref:hypothetical protein n=1 Tax=Nocardia sp. BMG51109 TaxID=1056816 RepID=UPI0004B04F6E|nr:hypothetical protein [Nocardia sp. BMG51109]
MSEQPSSCAHRWRARETALLRRIPPLPPDADRHPGTNGWLSSFGTCAHGRIAGCPPGH